MYTSMPMTITWACYTCSESGKFELDEGFPPESLPFQLAARLQHAHGTASPDCRNTTLSVLLPVVVERTKLIGRISGWTA